jgi:hypothetical protein
MSPVHHGGYRREERLFSKEYRAAVVRSYYEYYQAQETDPHLIPDFHGLRDFYFLFRTLFSNVLEEKSRQRDVRGFGNLPSEFDTFLNCWRDANIRNFSGLPLPEDAR